jgi:hypothetical protein
VADVVAVRKGLDKPIKSGQAGRGESKNVAGTAASSVGGGFVLDSPDVFVDTCAVR